MNTWAFGRPGQSRRQPKACEGRASINFSPRDSSVRQYRSENKGSKVTLCSPTPAKRLAPSPICRYTGTQPKVTRGCRNITHVYCACQANVSSSLWNRTLLCLSQLSTRWHQKREETHFQFTGRWKEILFCAQEWRRVSPHAPPSGLNPFQIMR